MHLSHSSTEWKFSSWTIQSDVTTSIVMQPPRRHNDTRAKELKKKGTQEKPARTRGDRASGEYEQKKDKCVLCNGKHSTHKISGEVSPGHPGVQRG